MNSFKKIRAFSKINAFDLVSLPTPFALKYKNFSSLYTTDRIYTDSYLYGIKRQHNFLSASSYLNNQATLFSNKSLEKFVTNSKNKFISTQPTSLQSLKYGIQRDSLHSFFKVAQACLILGKNSDESFIFKKIISSLANQLFSNELVSFGYNNYLSNPSSRAHLFANKGLMRSFLLKTQPDFPYSPVSSNYPQISRDSALTRYLTFLETAPSLFKNKQVAFGEKFSSPLY
jgi:hypothetical protein